MAQIGHYDFLLFQSEQSVTEILKNVTDDQMNNLQQVRSFMSLEKYIHMGLQMTGMISVDL